MIKKHRNKKNNINLFSFAKDYPEIVKIYESVKKTKSLLCEKVKDKSILKANIVDDVIDDDYKNTNDSFSKKHKEILKHFDEMTRAMTVEEYLVYSEQRSRGFSNRCKKEFSGYLTINKSSVLKMLNYLFIQQYITIIYLL